MILRKIFVLICAVIITFLAACEREVNNLENENIFASDTEYLVCPLNTSKCLTLVPGDKDGISGYFVSVCYSSNHEEIFRVNDLYRTRDTLLVLWDDLIERFWIYSGDIGTVCWEYEDGEWKEHLYNESMNYAKVPQALKDAKPNIFVE